MKAEGFWEVSRVMITVLLIALAIRFFLFQPFSVEGASMEPTFFNRDYLIVEKLSYHFREPERGETVVFRYPLNPEITYIKRIIGLPGETIRIENGQVFVDGVRLVEGYLTPNETTTVTDSPNLPFEITLRPDNFFIMGDNRDSSSDSRQGWTLPRENIIGRTAVVLFPRESFQIMRAPEY